MLRFGLYARKSDDDKRLTQKSTDEQIAECALLVERDGLVVVWQKEESKSARIPGERPLYSELIKKIERGQIDAIVCWHVNRLVRNMEEGGKLVQLLIDGRIKQIRTPHSTYRSGDNILPVVIEAASATQYSLDLSHVISRSMEGNFRSGGCNYKAPQGYRNLRDPLNAERGLIEPDSDRFVLIRRAWDEMLTGTWSVRDVWNHLLEWGYTVRATLNLPERPVRYPTVLEMFRNPFYAGFVAHKGELVRGRHKPMVSVDEFKLVQKHLGKSEFARKSHQHMFTGLMKCGYCGQLVTADTKRLRTGPWEHYRCSDTYGKCTKQGLSEAVLKGKLLQELADVWVDPEVLDIAACEIERGLQSNISFVSARKEQTMVSLRRLDERSAKLTEMWLSGLLTDEDRYRKIEASIKAEQRELSMLGDEDLNDLGRMSKNLRRTVDLIKTGKQRFHNADAKLVLQEIGSLLFFGHEKRVLIQVRDCVQEVVNFAKAISGSFEPPGSGSESNKKTAFFKPSCLGGGESALIEVPKSLLEALEADDLYLLAEPKNEMRLESIRDKQTSVIQV